MKIALCLSGQPRTYKKCFKSIKKHIIDQYKIEDVFIHFWWDPLTNNQGSLASCTHGDYNNNKKAIYIPLKKNKPDLYNDLKNLYNPKLIEYNKPKSFHLPSRKKLTYYNNIFLESKIPYKEYPKTYQEFLYNHLKYNHFRSQYLCSKLKNENEKIIGQKYDLIIRTRFDIIFNDHLWPGGKLPQDLWEQSENRGIGRFLPSLSQLKNRKDKSYFIFDNFWIYSSKTHDLMMKELYLNFNKNFLSKEGINLKGLWGVGEPYQRYIMDKHKISMRGGHAEAFEILR